MRRHGEQTTTTKMERKVENNQAKISTRLLYPIALMFTYITHCTRILLATNTQSCLHASTYRNSNTVCLRRNDIVREMAV